MNRADLIVVQESLYPGSRIMKPSEFLLELRAAKNGKHLTFKEIEHIIGAIEHFPGGVFYITVRGLFGYRYGVRAHEYLSGFKY